MGVRINKYIASSGMCSRRQADELIEAGKVTIDGIPAQNGAVVEDGMIVKIDDKEIFPEDKKFILLSTNPSASPAPQTDVTRAT